MDNRQIQLIKVLSQEAVRLFWEDSFRGKAYGSRHLQRVQRIAEYLWKEEGGDKFIVLAGAWVHDVALAHGPDYEPERVADLTRKFLIQFTSLQKDEIDGLVACAEGHESGGDFLSLEAKLVHDADVLDKSGLLGVVRHIWKMTNMLENRILTDEHDLKRLENHLRARKKRLFTNTAKRLANYLKEPLDHFFGDRRFALETMTWISQQSDQGIISDTIAEVLASRSDHTCVERLKGQLECSYLNL